MDLHPYETERHDITRHDSHPHWENDMVHNYAHGLSMSNHFACRNLSFGLATKAKGVVRLRAKRISRS